MISTIRYANSYDATRYVLYGENFVQFVNIRAVQLLLHTRPDLFVGDADKEKNLEITRELCHGPLENKTGVHGLKDLFE
jgi:hypothetical protein